MTRYRWDVAIPATDTVRRCCSSHDSLDELTQHLRRDFDTLDVRTVAREVARAVAAAKLVGIATDELLMIELVARAQLELRAGHRAEVARLDRENHPGRAQGTVMAAGSEPAIA